MRTSFLDTSKRAFNWLFRNRQTGRITILQLPNISLAVFLIATATRRIGHPAGTAGTVVTVTAGAALACWAIDELVRGVNPWRRILGGSVLVIELGALLTHH